MYFGGRGGTHIKHFPQTIKLPLRKKSGMYYLGKNTREKLMVKGNIQNFAARGKKKQAWNNPSASRRSKGSRRSLAKCGRQQPEKKQLPTSRNICLAHHSNHTLCTVNSPSPCSSIQFQSEEKIDLLQKSTCFYRSLHNILAALDANSVKVYEGLVYKYNCTPSVGQTFWHQWGPQPGDTLPHNV